MGKLQIPEIRKIVEEAIEAILRRKKKESIKELFLTESFSNVINEIEEEADKLYRMYEKEAIKRYLKEKGWPICEEDLAEALLKIIDNSLVTSIANTRRSRAGWTSQYILAKALRSLGIPCEISNIKEEGYRPDLIVPSNDIAKHRKDLVFAIAVKRTLRERWAEDIDIFNKFPNSAFVLIKPDPDFTPKKAEDMAERNMRLVYIPDVLYERYKDYLGSLKAEKGSIFKRLSDLPHDLRHFLMMQKR